MKNITSILVFLAVMLPVDSDGAGGALLRGMTSRCITCSPCSKEVCCYNECSTNDPFVCTQGYAIGWCSNSSTHWTEIGYNTCQECCNLSNCPAEECEARAIKGNCLGPCPLEVCVVNECPMKHPFVCTLGASLGRCDNRSTYFAEHDENCSECCDKRTCATTDPTCYKQCSNDVCNRRQCTNDEPYACIKADTENEATNPIYGCHADESYWLQDNSTCDECCDVRLCLWIETPIPLTPETLTVTDAPLPPVTSSYRYETPIPLTPLTPGRIQSTTETPRASKMSIRSHATGCERQNCRH